MWVENLTSSITMNSLPPKWFYVQIVRKGVFQVLKKDNSYFIETVTGHRDIMLNFYQLIYKCSIMLI